MTCTFDSKPGKQECPRSQTLIAAIAFAAFTVPPGFHHAWVFRRFSTGAELNCAAKPGHIGCRLCLHLWHRADARLICVYT